MSDLGGLIMEEREDNIIYEDFIQDREVKMINEFCPKLKRHVYLVHVQVFTTDNLPFSPMTGKMDHIFFNYNQVSTEDVDIKGVVGNFYNSIIHKYETTDHTFVVGVTRRNDIAEKTAIRLLRQAAKKVIGELNKRVVMPHMARPHILTDVQRAEQLLTDRNVKITKLSRKTGIPAFTLYNYRKNPEALKKTSHVNIERLMTQYYETYFNRNEVERFRFMLIKTVRAYLKETKNNPIVYNPVY